MLDGDWPRAAALNASAVQCGDEERDPSRTAALCCGTMIGPEHIEGIWKGEATPGR